MEASTQTEALGWLKTMYGQLAARSTGLKVMDAYYRGDHPLPFLTKAHQDKIRSEFRQMLDDSRSNFMRLIVDVVDERLQVEGFRLSAESDAQTDKDSWDIWQANNLDSLSRVAFLETLIKGVSYMSVWEDDDGDGYADIGIEDPLETIVSYTPGSNFRKTDAALKAWNDVAGSGMERANVYLPDGIWKFQRPLAGMASLNRWARDSDSRGWELLKEDWFVANKAGMVPIVALRNRPRLLLEGESEIADHIQIQNQINGFTFLLALGGYFGAHKQRWATGITMETDEVTGLTKEPFDVAIDKLIANENPLVKFGEFQQTDLSGYMKAIDQKVEHLAVNSRTPRHYFSASGQEPSGDAIKSAESGLVKKVQRKQEVLSDGLEQVIRLARKFMDAPDMPVDSQVVWTDPQTESEGARTDAVIKKYGAGLIPKEQALEDLGYTQTEIARMLQQEAAAKLLGEIATAAPSAPGAPPGPIVIEPGDQAVDPGPSQVKGQTIRA